VRFLLTKLKFMKKLKKFFNAFLVVVGLLGPLFGAAAAVMADKPWAMWPIASYIITIPLLYALMD